MRTYLIDEITPSELEKINEFLERHAIKSHLDRVFWVQIPESILSKTQIKHTACQPYVFSVEMGPDWIKLEFFIRSLKTMRCTCPDYCSTKQMDYVIRFSHRMIEQLGIRT